MIEVSRQRFEELVSDALDQIPPDLLGFLDNVAIVVEEHDPLEPDLLGVYHGVALTDRDSAYTFAVPDTITIYRLPILALCDSEAEVAHEVAVTVVHEIGHHFGIEDDRLHQLGWG